MHVRCPDCRSPVELLDDWAVECLACPSCHSSFSLAVDETISLAAAGRRMLGQFELLEIIGGGAFGTVWKGRDCQLDRIVAIKVPRAGQLDKKGTDVFLGEARAAARLKHPNIVSIHEVGRDQETLYIVSDLVDGVTLSDWLTGMQPTAIEAASLCAKIALALDHAHAAGIVHRDLKPSNVPVDPPEPAPPTGVALEEQPDTYAQPLAATPAPPSAMPAEADSDELLNRFRELENISVSVADSLRAAGLAPSMIGD